MARKREYTQEEIQENSFIYDRWFDQEYIDSLQQLLFSKIDEHYFRVRYIGFGEEAPKRNDPERPLIYFGNHSGMAFPWDAIMFSSGLYTRYGYNLQSAVRALVAPALTKFRLMNAFLITDFWKRCGAADATTLNFETMMHYQGSQVLTYPEGIAGIGKGFNRKYQLRRFATSFIRMSLKYKTDIVPICTVNGEYINPHSYSFKWVNKLSQKLGIPFLPVSWILLFLPFCPWLFYFAFPARLTFVKGRRLSPWKWIDKDFSEVTQEEIDEIRDRVQASMQDDLTAAAEEYGKRPYEGWRLFVSNLRNFKNIAYFHSPAWPFLFSEHERLYRKFGKGNFKLDTSFWGLLKAIWHNPLKLAFFIPILGWIYVFYLGYRK